MYSSFFFFVPQLCAWSLLLVFCKISNCFSFWRVPLSEVLTGNGFGVDESAIDIFVLSWSGTGKWKYEKSEGHEDYGLLVSQPAKKYGIAVDLPEEVNPTDNTVVLQYDLRLQKGLECGGAYLKYLLPQVGCHCAVI